MIKDIVKKFLDQSKTNKLTFANYPREIDGMDLKVSFGKGNPAKIPWIGFLKKPNTIQKGIYPVFLLFKDINKLILAYGISETKNTNSNWKILENTQTINTWYQNNFGKNPYRYGKSYVKSIYDLNKSIDYQKIQSDFNSIIESYNKQTFSKNIIIPTNKNYWIFQGNPKVFDFETALRDDIISDWTVSAHKDKIKIGDKIILWITGTKSGCYALAEVTSKPLEKSHSPDDKLWKTDNKNQLKVEIKITHNLINSPILKSEIDSFEELNQLKVGNQGTNFSATKKEYQTLLDLISSNTNKSYYLIKNALDQTLVSEYITFLRNYVNQKQLQPEDKRISFNIRPNHNRLVFIIGSRYAFVIQKIKKKTELSFIYKSALTIESESFTNQKQEIEAYLNNITKILDYESEIKEGLDIELERNNKNPFKKYTNREFIEDIYQSKNVMNKKNSNSKMNLSLNTILYGPPGTGKTYRLKNEFFNKFIDESSIKTEEEFLQELVSEFSWWEVIAASLHIMQKAKVAQISKHPLIKAKLTNSSNNSLRATIWGTLQAHTVQECEYVNVESRQVPLIFSKNEDSIWEVLAKNLESEAPEVIELVSKSKEFKPQTFSKKRYVFTTFHQSFSYEDFIEGIKPVIYENEQNPTLGKQVIYEIKPGLFKQIVKDANADRDNDYAIFIDEINRGNIANIFGELITLIEDDKRIDTDNYIPAKLPYSNEDFGVPPNLYIIGTMNTADRSVEALDTALRRRFSFIEMNPEPAKLSTTEFKCDGIDLESLLISINSRIEKLLDKDYCIGHSYFMTIKNRKQPLNEIKAIFKNKILPLLQEYFYGDWGKIMLVIGKEFVEKKKGNIKFLSTDSYDEFEEYDEKPIYNFTNSSKWTLDSFLSIYE